MGPSYPRYEGIELIIPAGTTANQVNFPDIPELRSDFDKDAIILSAAVSCLEAVPKTYSGNTNATNAQVANAFLTLYVVGLEQVFRLELIRLMDIENALSTTGYFFAREKQKFQPLRVDWTKSYVSFGQVGTVDTPAYSFMFTFGYDWWPSGSYEKWLQCRQGTAAAGMFKIP